MSKTKVNQKKEKSHLSIFVCEYVYIFKFYDVYFPEFLSNKMYIYFDPTVSILTADALIIMYNEWPVNKYFVTITERFHCHFMSRVQVHERPALCGDSRTTEVTLCKLSVVPMLRNIVKFWWISKAKSFTVFFNEKDSVIYLFNACENQFRVRG